MAKARLKQKKSLKARLKQKPQGAPQTKKTLKARHKQNGKGAPQTRVSSPYSRPAVLPAPQGRHFEPEEHKEINKKDQGSILSVAIYVSYHKTVFRTYKT